VVSQVDPAKELSYVASLRALLSWAERAGAPEHLQSAAARELVALVDRAPPDRRRTMTLERGRRIEALRAQGVSRADICTRLRLTPRQHDRARAVLRDCGSSDAGDFPPAPPKE
jgi:hypothetical protein